MNNKFIDIKISEKKYFYPFKELEIRGMDENIKEYFENWYAYYTKESFSKEINIKKGIDIFSYLVKQLGNFSDVIEVECVKPLVKKSIGNLVFKCKDIKDNDTIILFENDYMNGSFSTISVINNDYINNVNIFFRECDSVFIPYVKNCDVLDTDSLQKEYDAQYKLDDNKVIKLNLVK